MNARLQRILGRLGALAALALLFTSPAQAMPGQWKLDSISFTGRSGQVHRFIYVPKGAQWSGVTLHFKVEPAADSFVAVWIDGERIMRRQFDEDSTADVDIGNLAAGFHRVRFTLEQQNVLTALTGSDDGAQEYCAGRTTGDLIVKDLMLSYFQVADKPTLSDLPDPLFNPQMPSQHPWRAMVVADTDDSPSVSVAARLASGWRAVAGIRWSEAKLMNAYSADFVIELQHRPKLDVPARLDLIAAHTGRGTRHDGSGRGAQFSLPARLRIIFRDKAGAFSAANALLNDAFRAHLDTASADLQHAVAAPVWGAEKTYETLADYGVSDFSLGERHHTDLFLPVPAAWHATGPAHGTLVYRTQKGLLGGSSLRLWVNKKLAGSDRLDQAAGKYQLSRQMPFHALAPLSGTRLLPARLNAQMLVTRQCLPGYDGLVWVDAEHSKVDIPHRYKTGVGALQVALIARPDIDIDGRPGSLTAALALAASMYGLVGEHPLPFHIRQANRDPADAPVWISVGAGAYRRQASGKAERLGPATLKNGTLLSQKANTYRVLGSNSTELVNFAAHWNESRFDIKDGSDKAYFSSAGIVTMSTRSPVASALAVSGTDHFRLLIYIGFALLILVMILAWWLGRRRRG